MCRVPGADAGCRVPGAEWHSCITCCTVIVKTHIGKRKHGAEYTPKHGLFSCCKYGGGWGYGRAPYPRVCADPFPKKEHFKANNPKLPGRGLGNDFEADFASTYRVLARGSATVLMVATAELHGYLQSKLQQQEKPAKKGQAKQVVIINLDKLRRFIEDIDDEEMKQITAAGVKIYYGNVPEHGIVYTPAGFLLAYTPTVSGSAKGTVSLRRQCIPKASSASLVCIRGMLPMGPLKKQFEKVFETIQVLTE